MLQNMHIDWHSNVLRGNRGCVGEATLSSHCVAAAVDEGHCSNTPVPKQKPIAQILTRSKQNDPGARAYT